MKIARDRAFRACVRADGAACSHAQPACRAWRSRRNVQSCQPRLHHFDWLRSISSRPKADLRSPWCAPLNIVDFAHAVAMRLNTSALRPNQRARNRRICLYGTVRGSWFISFGSLSMYGNAACSRQYDAAWQLANGHDSFTRVVSSQIGPGSLLHVPRTFTCPNLEQF